ncbi:MAG: hypothetical protein GOV02_00125 [Candidatus Aenigmarchaeota archaeon]|nr:hypothetical protein [Candidatus Aenigmarchaeota archaeon]
MTKILVGLIDKVKVKGKKTVETIAKFDTGAKRTSIDMGIAAKAMLGPVVDVVKVKTASLKGGYVKRPVVEAEIHICGKRVKIKANIEDRVHSKQKVLIGRDIIKSNFIVDLDKV